jgi:hypothetical protein
MLMIASRAKPTASESVFRLRISTKISCPTVLPAILTSSQGDVIIISPDLNFCAGLSPQTSDRGTPAQSAIGSAKTSLYTVVILDTYLEPIILGKALRGIPARIPILLAADTFSMEDWMTANQDQDQ